MGTIRAEKWNGSEIRFVEVDGDWWAVAVDITKALSIGNTTMALRRIGKEDKALISIEGISKGNDLTNVLSEFGIYELVFSSHKPEAKDFKKWTFNILKELRQSAGLEGFRIFCMFDKDFQKEQMQKIRDSLKNPTKIDYIKANTIANKAVSNKYGFDKMVKKPEMTPEMLVERQAFLEDAVQLMVVKERFGLDLSVSEEVYKKAVNH